MAYLCNRHGLTDLYPEDPGERAMVDSAMYYVVGTLYPLIGRATYQALGFPQYPGEDTTPKGAADAAAALAEPLEAIRAFFLDGKRFIGGDRPGIADFRLAASLEFLRAIDYAFPDWAEEYMSAIESALGEAYSEPVADVRGYLEYARSQAAAAT
jgi:glutathione S-transferase